MFKTQRSTFQIKLHFFEASIEIKCIAVLKLYWLCLHSNGLYIFNPFRVFCFRIFLALAFFLEGTQWELEFRIENQDALFMQLCLQLFFSDKILANTVR